MDMYTNNQVDNQNVSAMEGYKEVTKDEFLKELFKEEDNTQITKALTDLLSTQKKLNDKKYPVISTGRVVSINNDGKINVQILGDDSEIVESVGYINQTPFVVNVNDYVKICKQTAGDKVNSWIMGVNNIANKEDAFVIINYCLDYILQLQEEIDDLGKSIKELSQSFESTAETQTITVGTSSTSVTVPIIKINSTKMNSSISRINTLNSVKKNIEKQKEKLSLINKGKKNN